MNSFFIVGANRAGTSFLNYYVSKHPEVLYGRRRCFYSNGNEQNNPGVEWLNRKIYNPLGGITDETERLVFGDACGKYFSNPQSPKRIFHANPKAKIIVILRNPVDRAESQYAYGLSQTPSTHRQKLPNVNVTINEEILLEQVCLNESLPGFRPMKIYNNLRTYYNRMLFTKNDVTKKNAKNLKGICSKYFPLLWEGTHVAAINHPHDGFGLLYNSYYVDHLKRWLEFFPRKQIHIVNFDHMVDDPYMTLLEVWSFLELDPFTFSDFGGFQKRVWGEETRERERERER